MDESKDLPKILIADDNLQNVELLEAYLGGLDCEILTANDGEETLQAVERQRPDLVLLDVMMPRLSGFEVCRKLRANPETRETLILMVTALNEASDFERGVQAGTDDFLTKPVNKVELLCRIKSLLRVRHLKSQLDRTLAYLAEVESVEPFAMRRFRQVLLMTLPRVVLKPRRARPFFARHPWVFASSIARVEGEPAPGDEVAVHSHEGRLHRPGPVQPPQRDPRPALPLGGRAAG